MTATIGHIHRWQWPLTGPQVESDARTALLGRAEALASLEVLSAEAVRVALWARRPPLCHVSIRDAAITTRDALSLARTLLMPFRTVDGASEIVNGTIRETLEDIKARSDDDTPDATVTPNRRLLDLLADQGDMQPLPKGHWVPAPLRLVPIIENQLSLLVGSLPTRALPIDVQAALQLFGAFRRIAYKALDLDTSALAALLRIPIQPLSQWLGPMPPTRDALLEWMRTRELAPVVDKASFEVEAYAPFVNKPQGLRWVPLRDVTRDGRYLLRRRMSWGSPRFTVGEIRRGELMIQSSIIPGEHIRRLQYALDWEARTPTTAEWSPQRGTLTLQSEIPTRERKLLSTLGTLEANGERYYPRRWTHLPQTSAENIERMLTDLGITLIRF